MSPDLLPLDEVQRRLRVVGQSYAGIHPIEVHRIIGSVDRSLDFDRCFTPRLHGSAERMASLRAGFPSGDLPPIEAYEVGGAYFVADGHHRVALAMQRGADYIDAEVTRLETNYEIGPGHRRLPADPHGAAADPAARERPGRGSARRGHRVLATRWLPGAARADQGTRLRPRPPSWCVADTRGGRGRLVRPRLPAGGRRGPPRGPVRGLHLHDRRRPVPVGLPASTRTPGGLPRDRLRGRCPRGRRGQDQRPRSPPVPAREEHPAASSYPVGATSDQLVRTGMQAVGPRTHASRSELSGNSARISTGTPRGRMRHSRPTPQVLAGKASRNIPVAGSG